MHYELYVDSLFFLNFIMNLYLLILVNRSTFRTATPGRIAAGAALGAAGFLLPFLGGSLGMGVAAAGTIAGAAGMLFAAFPVRSLRMFLKLLEKLLLYSFGLGGMLLFLVRSLPGTRKVLTSVPGLLAAGGLAFWLYYRGRQQGEASGGLCRATLARAGVRMKVNALVDSGNSLVEPISGKPVCVVGKKVYETLWGGETEGFRVIPYHSIGKSRGVLPGYLLPRLEIELEGLERVFENVYIAVSDGEISGMEDAGAESVKMIINPGLLTGRPGGCAKRQNERYDDSESDTTGKDSVQDDTQGEAAPGQKRRYPLHRGRGSAAAASGGGTGEPGHRGSGNGV